MKIAFRFNPDKSVQVMAYFLSRLGPTDKVKLMKLLYIADRNHFIQYGYPLTGSRQVAMDYGPLPSECLNLVDGGYQPDPGLPFRVLTVKDATVSLVTKTPKTDGITKEELATLNKVVEGFGSAGTWDLKKHTHKFPEYERVYEVGTSKTITYELLQEVYNRLSYGRPVVKEAALPHLQFSFKANSDADL